MRTRILAALLLVSVAARAAPPPSGGEQSAARLHTRAAAEFKKGQLQAAIDDWQAAEQLHHFWKYAFNLAAAYAQKTQWEDAETALRRSIGYGVDAKYQPTIDDLKGRIEAALLSDHALIELVVAPEDATVSRNGTPWAPPWRAWVREPSSTLHVEHAGMKIVERQWDHPAGSRVRLDLSLEKLPAHGKLVVHGAPIGAEILLDGRSVGRLPRAELTDVDPGRHTLVVSAPGFDKATLKVNVVADTVADSAIDLHATPPPPVVEVVRVVPPPVPRRTAVWGWVTLGTGAAALATAGALYGWSGKLASDIRSLNESPGASHGDFSSYADDYDAQVEKRDRVMLAGHVMVGLGAALAVAGGVLVWLDGGADEAPRTSMAVIPLPSGAAVRVDFGF